MTTPLRSHVPREPIAASDGEMAGRIGAYDWGKTALGTPETWAPAFKTTLALLLASPRPMLLWWGPALTTVYNDAFAAFLHSRHPEVFGLPAPQVLGELWGELRADIEVALGGAGTHAEQRPVIVERSGYAEEIFVTASLDPVLDREGVGGVLCTLADRTAEAVSGRRLATEAAIAARIGDARSSHEACSMAAGVLNRYPDEVPFALMYVLDAGGATATLKGWSGVAPGGGAAPRQLAANARWPWPVHQIVESRQACHLTDLTSLGRHLPVMRYRYAVSEAFGAPLVGPVENGPVGVFIAGLNPLRLYDVEYRRFLERVSNQIGAAISLNDALALERRRSQRVAEREHARATLIADLAEQCRGPLMLVLAPTDEAIVAVASGNDSASLAPLLTTARHGGQHLQKLLDTLLDFSLLQAGRTRATREPLDLAAFTEDLAATFRPAIERAGLDFDVACDPLVGLVRIDGAIWEKVVLHLLSNAFKFTFNGRIAVTLQANDDAVVLTVSDTGIGIAPDNLPHLLTGGVATGAGRGRSPEGTGLGLVMVREMVALLDGEIAINSQPELGTVVTLRLPVEKVETSPLPESHAEPDRALRSAFVSTTEGWAPAGLPALDDTAASAETRILVVEASKGMRAYLTRLLLPRWRVHAVADAPAALDSIAANLPDLVLGEVMMPAPGGASLLRHLRDDPRTVGLPVLLLSSRAGEDARIEGMEVGADDYMVKPSSGRELVARVAAHLELARTRTRIQQELRAARDALQTELAATARLHGFTTRLLSEAPVGRVLEDFLDAVVTLQGADAGTLLLANRRTGRFECVARRGFADDAVLDDLGAIAERRRIVVEDAGANGVAAALMPAARAAGYRAWQSTPLLSAAGDLLGVLTTYFESPHRPTPHQLRLTDVYARVSAVIFERRWLEGERQDLMQKMVAAEEAERRRISRELHDTIGQHLASLMLGLKLLRAAVPRTAAGLVDQLRQLTDVVGRQVHDLALDLRPTALDDLGLPGALAAFVSEWSRSSGVHADFHAHGWHETRFAPEAENAVYRVVLEALTNVQRHANARRAGVILECRADEVLAIVEDDGKGFDVEAMSLIGSTRRLGLIGMKERASLVGGMLTIESGTSGTTVFIRVPIGTRG